MNLEEKIKSFEQSCYNLASNEAECLKKEIEEEIENQLKIELEEYMRKKEWNYNKSVENLEREYKKEIFQIQNDCKKEILNAKTSIYEDLKKEVENRINNFVDSDKYEDFLFKTIKKSAKQFDDKKDIVIGITKKDKEKFENKIKELYSCEIKIIEPSYIGGCMMQNKNMCIDNTLKNTIEEKMKD